MKKQTIISFLCGAVLFGSVGAFAGQYIATDNPYPIKLNGKDIELEGYNINDNTFFKLRDIANTTGGFDVSFENDTIVLNNSTNISLIDYAVYTDNLNVLSDIIQSSCDEYNSNWSSFNMYKDGTLIGDINEFLSQSLDRHQVNKKVVEHIKWSLPNIQTIDCTELSKLVDDTLNLLDFYCSATNLTEFENAASRNNEDEDAELYNKYYSAKIKAEELYKEIYDTAIQ